MQTRKPELKFLRVANRSLQVPANIIEKADGEDAPPVGRRPQPSTTPGGRRSGRAVLEMRGEWATVSFTFSNFS